MKRLTFPQPLSHSHPPITNVNTLLDERESAGDRAADRVATAVIPTENLQLTVTVSNSCKDGEDKES